MSKKQRLITKRQIFDCKVCDHCLRAMTAKEYWTHNCFGKEPEMVKQVENNDNLETLQEEANNLRFELDDLYLEQEDLDVRIREKENELNDLEDRLAELEQEEDTEE
jgi:predicted RNase H-like nuclease (RuvC/YqgF family)